MDKLYFFALLGLTFHIIKSYEGVLAKTGYKHFGKALIDWPYQKVIVSSVLSVIAIVIIMSTKDSFKDIFPITTSLHAVVVGFSAQSLLKSLIDRKVQNENKQKRN